MQVARAIPDAHVRAFAVIRAIGAVASAVALVVDADQKLFNDATMIVMMREGTRSVLSMRNNDRGSPEEFCDGCASAGGVAS